MQIMANDVVKEALDDIISGKRIKTVFQPIISLKDGSILGHEALSRITVESIIDGPDMLFDIAGKYNRLWDLELLCRTKALEAAYKFMIPPYNKKLFLNVNPNVMHDESFKKGFTIDFLQQFQITPNNVIFEITERNVIKDMNGFRATIDHYKSQNYKIAIDDAGAGYSGLNLISDVGPNYIKLDIKLIRGVYQDNIKFALVKGMVELSKVSNIFLIAEGIESFEEMETLVNLGVQYGQGYYIQKPDLEVREISDHVLQDLKQINFRKTNSSHSIVSNIYIANLCTMTHAVSPNAKVSDVYNFCKDYPDCIGMCIIDNEVPVGIITKENLSMQLSGLYGFSLNHKKKISEIMDKDFLSVDFKTPINIVSSLAMERSKEKLYDFIVVTENDKYIGTVTIKDLLVETMEIEVSAAKHQNPLTGLPGNLMIEQRLNHYITSNLKHSIAYLDIDNFKAYNDVYGFEHGDLVINMLADILRDFLSEEQFIGHIGGDDFIVIIDDIVGDDYFSNIKSRFEVKVLDLYNPTDRHNRYMITANRHGVLERFPLLTLTVVVVNSQKRLFVDKYELSEFLAQAKKRARQKK